MAETKQYLPDAVTQRILEEHYDSIELLMAQYGCSASDVIGAAMLTGMQVATLGSRTAFAKNIDRVKDFASTHRG